MYHFCFISITNLSYGRHINAKKSGQCSLGCAQEKKDMSFSEHIKSLKTMTFFCLFSTLWLTNIIFNLLVQLSRSKVSQPEVALSVWRIRVSQSSRCLESACMLSIYEGSVSSWSGGLSWIKYKWSVSALTAHITIYNDRARTGVLENTYMNNDTKHTKVICRYLWWKTLGQAMWKPPALAVEAFPWLDAGCSLWEAPPSGRFIIVYFPHEHVSWW